MPQIYHVRLNAAVLAQLESIFHYIEQDSPQNAAKLIERILDGIESLDLFPHRFSLVAGEERTGIRSMP